MVPFLMIFSGLHNSNAFPEHLVEITDSRRVLLSLLLGRAINRAKTIDSSSVIKTTATTTTGKSCAAGPYTRRRIWWITKLSTGVLSPNGDKPVHGIQCGVPSDLEALLRAARCLVSQNKLKREKY
jgi:hypothetical protein